MSRCFPFPPPGFEKKPIPDVSNVLKKEKTKEKKHKEKKDKEKREGKDKRENKEKSNGKHREKKDKKEKLRDKIRDKEKQNEKDQEKGSTSVEKRVSGQSEEYNRAKFHPGEKERGKEKKERSNISEDKRQIGQFDYCNGEKLHPKVEKSRDKRNSSDEKKLAVQLQGHTGGDKPRQPSFADKDSQDSKFMLEFSKRISDEGKGSGSQLVDGYMDMGFKKVERTDEFAVRDTCMDVEAKEKIKDNQVDTWKIDGQRIHHEEKFNGNAMSQNLTGSIQNKIEVSKSKDKFEGMMEGNEKSKEREVDDKREDKRKSRHKDKQRQGKDKNSEKEKRKEDKAKKEHKKSEKDNSKSSNKNDIGAPSNKTSHLFKDSDKNAVTEGFLKKRKDIEKNGFLHEYVVRPEKIPRLGSHPLSENGQESETSQTTTLFTPQKQRAANNFVDNKDNKTNGLTGPHQLPISAPKPSPVIAEALRKPPHPDIKYLSKVLSVPQMDEWSDVDDQAWLFNIKESLLNKAEVDPVEVNQGQQVWADALRIESADVFALPYVIPY